MNAQGRRWKDTLDKGTSIILQMSGKRLEPSLSDGDAATVKRAPSDEIVVDDIILCEIRNKAALYRVSNIRVQSGVKVFEVPDAKGRLQSVGETSVLGKVVSTRRRSGLQEEKGVIGFLKRLFMTR